MSYSDKKGISKGLDGKRGKNAKKPQLNAPSKKEQDINKLLT
jgi:hypothetical protein